MAMRFSLLIGTLVLASACAGQSGSEVIDPQPPGPDPMPPITDAGPQPVPPGIPSVPHCPCDGLREQQQIRATVLAVETIAPFTNLWRYQLRAEEILSELPSNGDEPRVGDRFGGYWNGQLACGGEVQTPVDVGAQVLAFYRRGLQDGALCCEYLACSQACPSESEDDAEPGASSPHASCVQDCEGQSATACAEHREEAVMRGELLLIPWADELVVGESEHAAATITTADLPALTLARDACIAAIDDRYGTLHPPEPAPSADDAADDDAPVPGGPPPPTPPEAMPPTDPETPMMTPSASAATPDAGTAGAGGDSPPQSGNPSGEAVGPPPAHPEEVRVRCQ
jgi:hypothetical protein